MNHTNLIQQLTTAVEKQSKQELRNTPLRQLITQLTRTKDNTPLVVIKNLPGDGAELEPEQMRSLALAFLQIATECEARSMKKREFMAITKHYNW